MGCPVEPGRDRLGELFRCQPPPSFFFTPSPAQGLFPRPHPPHTHPPALSGLIRGRQRQREQRAARAPVLCVRASWAAKKPKKEPSCRGDPEPGSVGPCPEPLEGAPARPGPPTDPPPGPGLAARPRREGRQLSSKTTFGRRVRPAGGGWGWGAPHPGGLWTGPDASLLPSQQICPPLPLQRRGFKCPWGRHRAVGGKPFMARLPPPPLLHLTEPGVHGSSPRASGISG